MARAKKSEEVLSVGQLKKFLDDIPDRTPIRATWKDERVIANLWKRDDDESGPNTYLGFESE